jgi:hypothetical protein
MPTPFKQQKAKHIQRWLAKRDALVGFRRHSFKQAV